MTLTSLTRHDLDAAHLIDRTADDAIREVRADRATMLAALRALSATRACADCGDVLPAHRLHNTGVGHAPRWVCGLCRMVEGSWR